MEQRTPQAFHWGLSGFAGSAAFRNCGINLLFHMPSNALAFRS